MGRKPVRIPGLSLQPAVDAVFAREEAKLLETLRKRRLSFSVAPMVWQRLAGGLADWQKGVLSRVIRIDFELMGEIPYVKLDEPETQRLYGALASAEEVRAFDREVASKKRETRTDAEAVAYYQKTILLGPKGSVWLRSRQPKGMTLVDRTLGRYTEGMDLCLERIEADRAYLAQCFFDGKPIQRLADVTITDSDPHKSGKRVLFLDFNVDSPGARETRRVVYKPSDVEIDYRIAGKNTEVTRKLFEDEHASGRFPEPHESFFELLDRLTFEAENAELSARWSPDPAKRARLAALLALPTYVILPRNPGSRLQVDPATDRLPIDTSYGYLEYLPFQPRPPQLGATPAVNALPQVRSYLSHRSSWQWDPRAPKNALDWIVDDRDLALPAFRVWGRLMSIACVLLQTDLHHQNQRLRGCKPHVIDLENCLIKSCPTPGGQAGTMIPESLLKVAAAGAQPFTTEGTNNQLYLQEADGSAVWLSMTDPAAEQEVKEGVREALFAMSDLREEIANWIQASGLADVVVRHVVEQTGALTQAMADFNAELLNPTNADKKTEDLLRVFLEDRRDMAVAEWRRAPRSSYMREDNPKYALMIPEYNGRDFVERCIPVYYRRAGSRDLLTWWGETVQYRKQPDDKKDLAFEHYHRHTGLDLLKTSLTEKLPKDPAQLEEIVERFIASVFPTTTPDRGGSA